MIALVVAGAVAVVAGTGAIGLALARRVVATSARPRPVRVRIDGPEVTLDADERTSGAGEYLLVLSGGPTVHVGRVIDRDAKTVRRELLGDLSELPSGEATGIWSSHRFADPAEIGECRNVEIPMSSGEHREAWLFSGDPAHWVIHVQGVRTTRGVTLRSVHAASAAGATSLAITYRGAGDGPETRAATLGAREWVELRDAVEYARSSGAERVTVIAWSMGAALALELLRNAPRAINDLVLICPVTSWPATMEYGARRAGLPGSAAKLAGLILRNKVCSRILGMAGPVDVRRLVWTGQGSLPVPTMVIHSQGDEVVPWETTVQLVANNPNAELVETIPCPHGFELTPPDPETEGRLISWLIS